MPQIITRLSPDSEDAVPDGPTRNDPADHGADTARAGTPPTSSHVGSTAASTGKATAPTSPVIQMR